MIVYLARDIPGFVMYCVDGASRSSLLGRLYDSVSMARIFAIYICQAVRRAVNVLNVSMCI